MMNTAQSVDDDYARAITEAQHPLHMALIHDVEPLAHYRFQYQVLSYGDSGGMTQMLSNGMAPPKQNHFWIFACEIDYSSRFGWVEFQNVAASNTACNTHCRFQSPIALACRARCYQRAHGAREKAGPDEVQGWRFILKSPHQINRHASPPITAEPVTVQQLGNLRSAEINTPTDFQLCLVDLCCPGVVCTQADAQTVW